jgi:hypothetical protein
VEGNGSANHAAANDHHVRPFVSHRFQPRSDLQLM